MYGKKPKKMKMGGYSGGNRSGAPRRMVADPAMAQELNPGKMVDVTEMSKGGYMNDKVAEKMMGGYMKYEDKK